MYKSSVEEIKYVAEREPTTPDELRFPRREFHNEWTYEIDLQLAAELGKTLLQRNNELERNLTTYQDLAEDQALEIDFLTKQVQLLRDENDTRLAACEMLESQLQELKRSESSLQDVRGLDYMRINRLQDTVEVLQSRCEELQVQLTESKRKNWELKFSSSNSNQNPGASMPTGMTRSTSHGDALKSASKNPRDDSDDETDGHSSEILILKEKIDLLQRQVTDQRKQNELLQDQVMNVAGDNTSLWQQLNHVSKEAASWREKLEQLTGKYAEEIATFNEAREKFAMESGAQEQLKSDSVISHGTQLSILDEIADSLRDRFLEDLKREQEEQEKPEKFPSEEESESSGKLKCKTTQTDTGLIIEFLASRGGDPTQGRFERGPPEYKKLFKEIFDIIKKSQEETVHTGQTSRTRNKKSKKVVIDYYNQF